MSNLDRLSFKRAVAAFGAAVLISVCGASAQTAPSGQRVPWRAGVAPNPFHSLNSVVEINRFNAAGNIVEFGSGTVLGKRYSVEGGQTIGWLCVLTADHVVNNATAADYKVRFGDNAAQGAFGGATNFRFLAPDPVAQGGLNTPVDIAVLGIRYGPVDQFFNRLTDINAVARTSSSVENSNMTQVGYGDTGEFVAANAGAGTPAGIRRDSRDSIKGFQNQKVERTVAHTRPRTVDGAAAGNYNFTAVEHQLDQPAAPNAAAPHPFLVGEGTSFPGDSGGPYFYAAADTQDVAAFNRPGAGSDWNPAGGIGPMDIFTNSQFAVHSYGQTVAVGSVAPYGRTSGGVLLTQAHLDWIAVSHQKIPAPAGVSMLAVAGIAAFRRRRA